MGQRSRIDLKYQSPGIALLTLFGYIVAIFIIYRFIRSYKPLEKLHKLFIYTCFYVIENYCEEKEDSRDTDTGTIANEKFSELDDSEFENFEASDCYDRRRDAVIIQNEDLTQRVSYKDLKVPIDNFKNEINS